MLNLKNTLDGYLKNVEVIGNTIQDTNNLANIRSVGDKVEGQELYKIDVVSCGKNLFNIPKHLEKNMEWKSGNVSYLIDYVELKPNTDYKFTAKYTKSNAQVGHGGIGLYLMNSLPQVEDIWYITQTPRQMVYQYEDYNQNINKTFNSGEYKYVALYVGVATSSSYNHVATLDNAQLEEGTVATPYEPYKENKLEILSPVQLEKVGDVVDRIICKDGVWGVEKNVGNYSFNGSENWVVKNKLLDNTIRVGITFPQCLTSILMSNQFKFVPDSSQYVTDEEGISINNDNLLCFRVLKSKISEDTLNGVKKWLSTHNLTIKYLTTQPQFIPLPHDQQVKLRTFAGQTNIAFLTEIPGQIKAQVPKSLGATVNTHTEQIAELHNSLDRVKKLEETTVSTVETESNFTTVDATSNGYFEDVKLEGKTLVNKSRIKSKHIISSGDRLCNVFLGQNLSQFTLIVDVSNLNGTLKSYGIYADNNQDIYTQTTDVNGKWITYFNLNRPIKEFTLYVDGGTNHEAILDNIVVLEGDHTNNPPGYYKGLMSVGQDVEEVSVESVSSGNLIDLSRIVVGKYIANNNKDVEHGTSFYCDKYVKVYPGVKYQLIASDNSNQICRVSCYDKTSNYISTTEYATNTPIYFDSTVDTIRLSFFDRLHLKDMLYFGTNSNYIGQVIKPNKKPLLYYNPTTETWEKPILRKWDSIEKHSDGKYYYHKRSGEVVLNGSESWTDATSNSTNGYRLSSNVIESDSIYKGKLLCDNLNPINTVTPGDSTNSNFTLNTISISTYNTMLYVTTQYDVVGFKAWLKANPTTVVYQLAQEEVYECTNIDLMTYSGETNYIINSGAISPKSLLKVHNNISNVVKILQEKVSLLENTFIAGLKSVLSGDMYSLATILYPEDFEQNDNTEQDIMVIPE